MPLELSPSARRVQEALESLGLTCRVLELPDSTRTADEAAKAVGCDVGQIVKSLIFKGKTSQTPLLVLVSGRNRVNENALGRIVAEKIVKPDAEFVRKATGFVIGGVPPLAHAVPLTTFIDEDLLAHRELWAAAGTPSALFQISPADLARATGGRVISVK